MDPITSSVVIILGKYALDKGEALGKEIGPKALQTVKEMFDMVLKRVRRDPTGEVIAGQFEQDPDTFQKPVEKALDSELQADPDLAAQLKALLDRCEREAQEHADATGGDYISLHGHSAAATRHSAAATSGAIAVGGSVHGGIHTSGRQAGETEPEQK